MADVPSGNQSDAERCYKKDDLKCTFDETYVGGSDAAFDHAVNFLSKGSFPQQAVQDVNTKEFHYLQTIEEIGKENAGYDLLYFQFCPQPPFITLKGIDTENPKEYGVKITPLKEQGVQLSDDVTLSSQILKWKVIRPQVLEKSAYS